MQLTDHTRACRRNLNNTVFHDELLEHHYLTPAQMDEVGTSAASCEEYPECVPILREYREDPIALGGFLCHFVDPC